MKNSVKFPGRSSQRRKPYLWFIAFVATVGVMQTNLLFRTHCDESRIMTALAEGGFPPAAAKKSGLVVYDREDDEPMESTMIVNRPQGSALDPLSLQPQQGCRTSFRRDSLPVEEQHFLLFSAPSPRLDAVPQAMLQWNAFLEGKGTLVVFVNENRQIYDTHGIPTVCVEHSDEGLPRFDQMLRRMHELQEPGGVVGFVNADIWIEKPSFEALNSFLIGLEDASFDVVKPSGMFKRFQHTDEQTRSWFTIMTRTDIDTNGTATPHTAGGYDFWAWNIVTPNFPLEVPAFRYPFAAYDGWLLDMMTQSSGVATIDASGVADLIHYEHKRVGNSTTWYQALSQGITGVYVNKHLSYTSVSAGVRHLWTFGTPLDTAYYAARNDQGVIDILPRKYWSNIDEKTLLGETDCWKKRCAKIVNITKRTADARTSVQSLPVLHQPRKGGKLWKNVSENWRYEMDRQLNEHHKNRTIILTGATYAYRDHLRNFKCNMERVGAGSHWLVAALDPEVYKWGVYQGFPIFLAVSSNKSATPPANSKKQRHMKKNDYGSQVFRTVTKLKSLAVLQVLERGFSVVWSDLDIAWFADPVATLQVFLDNGELGIQSNAPYVENGESAQPHPTVEFVKTDNPAAYRRLNSGLYAAPSTPLVTQAFRDIVAHARTSDKTEQPSFDEILCNINGSRRYKSSCVYERNGESLSVRLLNRFQFPNGAVLVSKGKRNVFELGKDFEAHTGVPLLAAHNNWIRSKENKLERHQKVGWWYAKDDNACLYPGDESTVTDELPESSDYEDPPIKLSR